MSLILNERDILMNRNEQWSTWQNQHNECAQWKTQIILGIRSVCSRYLLDGQWLDMESNFLHVDREDFDQTEMLPRLI